MFRLSDPFSTVERQFEHNAGLLFNRTPVAGLDTNLESLAPLPAAA